MLKRQIVKKNEVLHLFEWKEYVMQDNVTDFEEETADTHWDTWYISSKGNGASVLYLGGSFTRRSF